MMIAVCAPKAANLKNATLTSKDAGVTARWIDDAAQNGGAGTFIRHLSVHLGASVPTCNLRSGLKVRLGAGRALAIPVKGAILAAPGC